MGPDFRKILRRIYDRKIFITELRRIYDRKIVLTGLWRFYDRKFVLRFFENRAHGFKRSAEWKGKHVVQLYKFFKSAFLV